MPSRIPGATPIPRLSCLPWFINEPRKTLNTRNRTCQKQTGVIDKPGYCASNPQTPMGKTIIADNLSQLVIQKEINSTANGDTVKLLNVDEVLIAC